MASTVAIVTGGSSGIGKAVAHSLSWSGVKVYEFSRREVEMEGITHITADVTDDASVKAAVSDVLETEGRIDILVNCAGFGISGAVEFTDMELARKQVDVLFLGTARCCREVLPVMRRQGGGRIVCISSVAGPVPIPFQAFYGASKAAINNYVMALANEVRPYGVSVCAVMPGDTSTGFTSSRVKVEDGDDEYGGRISRSVSVMEHDETNGVSADVVGARVAKIALKKHVKPLYAVGFQYQFFTVLMRLLPCRLSNWMLGQIYAK